MNRDITFRDAEPTDAPGLAQIGRETFVEAFGSSYQPDDLRRHLEENYSIAKMRADLNEPTVEVRVAHSDRKMVAYCKIGPCQLPIDVGSEPALQLHRVYVYQRVQGVGVGRILLAWAIERARQRGTVNLFLGVQVSNERAVALYESRGFEKVGMYKLKVGSARDDEFIMRLSIRSD